MQYTEVNTIWLVFGAIAVGILLISYVVKSRRLNDYDKDKDINKREALLLLQQWKLDYETKIR